MGDRVLTQMGSCLGNALKCKQIRQCTFGKQARQGVAVKKQFQQ